MKFPGIGFFIGLTLTLFSLWFCYEVFTVEFTLNGIIVMIILFIPLGLLGLGLMSSAAGKTDTASIFLFGSIWIGVMCFGFAALMIFEATSVSVGPNYKFLSDRYSIPFVIFLGLAFTGIPLLIVYGLLKKNEPADDFEPVLHIAPKRTAAADNDPLGIRGKLRK
ncbi:MAG: hypothetical protein M3209_17440 [Acidobacteriota bacterium]|nr:hypothetical protein [Acidobacteriota bacterium]